MSGPNDWLHYFNKQNLATTTNEASNPPPHTQLRPAEGRVSKAIRRRSRTSRRIPTTLLNTDTTNFRAMVQQFTGGSNGHMLAPSASASFHHHHIQQQQLYQQHLHYNNIESGGDNNRFDEQQTPITGMDDNHDGAGRFFFPTTH